MARKRSDDFEKLFDLMLSYQDKYNSIVVDKGGLADHLLANGVTVQKHGRWIEWWPPSHMILTGEERLFRCSVCDAKYSDIDGMRFCPYCGAKMEG